MTLGALSWPEAQSWAGAVLAIPLGATEQHGPHLPLDTDTVIAVALARAASLLGPTPVLVAPALPFGSSGEHAGFAGTLSIGWAATELLAHFPHWPTDSHAGHDETSLMLALAPERVRREQLRAGVTAALPVLWPRLRAEGVRAVSPTGVLGDPRRASAAAGRALLDGAARELRRLIEEWPAPS